MISIRTSYLHPHLQHENIYCVNVDLLMKKFKIKRYMIVLYVNELINGKLTVNSKTVNVNINVN